MQRALFSLCGIDPLTFWKFTPAETYQMAEVAQEKMKYDDVRRAELLTCISNAPHFGKKDGKPFKITDYYHEFTEEKEQTVEEIEEMFWNAFGD